MPDHAFFAEQVAALASTDPTRAAAARAALLALDEAIIDPLLDQFYAGVSELVGLAIIDLVAIVGGYEVRLFLEDLMQADGMGRDAWLQAAIQALPHC